MQHIEPDQGVVHFQHVLFGSRFDRHDLRESIADPDAIVEIKRRVEGMIGGMRMMNQSD